jgi:hypothetical protein
MNAAKLILLKNDTFKTSFSNTNPKSIVSLRESLLMQFQFLKCKVNSLNESDLNKYMYKLKLEKLIKDIDDLISKDDICKPVWIKFMNYIKKEMNVDFIQPEKQTNKKQKISIY